MKKKKDLFKIAFNQMAIFKCPICDLRLEIVDNIICCSKKHCYDISKKGEAVLIYSSNLKKSKIYNEELFKNRRKFIQTKAYQKLYNYIIEIINLYLENKTKINILDLGCGEGSHINLIGNQIQNINIIGIDYSKPAIEQATDYLSESKLFMVGDINNVPLLDDSIDIVINILSPFNGKEIDRVLKKDGLLIKVSPNDDYLKELRSEHDLNKYEKAEDVLENISKRFLIKQMKNIKYEIELQDNEKDYVLNMTPLLKKVFNKKFQGSSISMDLNVYILKKQTK